MARVTLIALLLLVGGCAATVTVPPAISDSVPVYLTNYGRHSSLLITTRPGHLTEYAYGDWDWFAESRLSIGNALRAMLFSRGPTLGRRQLEVAGDVEAVSQATGAGVVHTFQVPRSRAEHLVCQLDAQFTGQLNTVTYNALSSMWFVRTDRRYHLFHNCNHATADWLKELGCKVSGFVMYSDFKVRATR